MTKQGEAECVVADYTQHWRSNQAKDTQIPVPWTQ